MSKISEKVSGNLAGAIQEAQNRITGGKQTVLESMDVNDLLNAGVEAMSEREEEDKPKKKRKSSKSDEPKEWPSNPILTHDEFCEQELRKAHEEGKPDPDFDFRESFNKGDRIYFVRVYNTFVKGMQLLKLKVRTVYPRMMVCVEEKAMCHCIGKNEVDQIFWNERDARAFMQTLSLPDVTEEEKKDDKPKKKRKKKVDDETEESVDIEETVEDEEGEEDDME